MICVNFARSGTEQDGLSKKQLEPNACLAKVNTEESQGLAQRFSIRSNPTTALFRGGREIARQSGAMGAAQIASWARTNA